MPISAFAEPEHSPTIDEVCDILGSRQSLWLELNQFLLSHYGLPGEWKFYGKSYGWMLWFRKSGRTIVSLYPQQEELTAQLVLGPTQIPAALNLRLSVKTRRLLQETPQLHDGRWLFIPIKSERDAREVEQLILLKAPLPKRRQAART